MSVALRVRVPLKAMCSRRCDSPCSSSCSEREPAPTQIPNAALSRCGMSWVTTRRPDSRLVTRTDIGSDLILDRAGMGKEIFVYGCLLVGKYHKPLLPR